jgi:8-oxo-dGTP diphosphatase
MKSYDPNIHNDARPNVGVTVVPIVFNQVTGELQTLIYRRDVNSEVFPGCICLPNGVYDRRKISNSDEAASVTLKGKLNIEIPHMEQLYTFSGDHIDPDRINTINITYWAALRQGEVVQYKDPTFLSEWVDIASLLEKPEQMFAFNHKEVLVMALERLKAKSRYLPVALSLLPKETTISDFKALTELLIDETLNNSRFRDRIKKSNVLTEIKGVQVAGVSKKSQAYRLNPNFDGDFYPKSMTKST